MDFNHSYSVLEGGISETLGSLLLQMLVYLSGYSRNYSLPFQEHWHHGCENFIFFFIKGHIQKSFLPRLILSLGL